MAAVRGPARDGATGGASSRVTPSRTHRSGDTPPKRVSRVLGNIPAVPTNTPPRTRFCRVLAVATRTALLCSVNGRRGKAAGGQCIFFPGHDAKMVWVHATPHPTQVVQDESIGYRPARPHPKHAMRRLDLSIQPSAPIPVIKALRPNPAARVRLWLNARVGDGETHVQRNPHASPPVRFAFLRAWVASPESRCRWKQAE